MASSQYKFAPRFFSLVLAGTLPRSLTLSCLLTNEFSPLNATRM